MGKTDKNIHKSTDSWIQKNSCGVGIDKFLEYLKAGPIDAFEKFSEIDKDKEFQVWSSSGNNNSAIVTVSTSAVPAVNVNPVTTIGGIGFENISLRAVWIVYLQSQEADAVFQGTILFDRNVRVSFSDYVIACLPEEVLQQFWNMFNTEKIVFLKLYMDNAPFVEKFFAFQQEKSSKISQALEETAKQSIFLNDRMKLIHQSVENSRRDYTVPVKNPPSETAKEQVGVRPTVSVSTDPSISGTDPSKDLKTTVEELVLKAVNASGGKDRFAKKVFNYSVGLLAVLGVLLSYNIITGWLHDDNGGAISYYKNKFLSKNGKENSKAESLSKNGSRTDNSSVSKTVDALTGPSGPSLFGNEEVKSSGPLGLTGVYGPSGSLKPVVFSEDESVKLVGKVNAGQTVEVVTTYNVVDGEMLSFSRVPDKKCAILVFMPGKNEYKGVPVDSNRLKVVGDGIFKYKSDCTEFTVLSK